MNVILTDNKHYIKQNNSNQFDLTTNIKDAKVFENEQKASNILVSLPKILQKYNWYIQPYASNKDNIFINIEYQDIEPEYLVSQLKIAGNLLAQTKGNVSHLYNKLSEIDKTQEDYLHFLENYNFSASEGYKIAKTLKDLRKQRRKIKNDIIRADIISNTDITALASGSLVQKLLNVDNRPYTPRIVTDIFDSRKPVGE